MQEYLEYDITDYVTFLGMDYCVIESPNVILIFPTCNITEEMTKCHEFEKYDYNDDWEWLEGEFSTVEEAHASAQRFISQLRQIEYGLDSNKYLQASREFDRLLN